MRPVFRLVAMALLVCLIGSGRAEAGIWDWLEELNGPGPSTGSSFPFMVSFLCAPYAKHDDAATQRTSVNILRKAFKTPDRETRVSTCFYYDTHSFHADADDRFHEVDSRLWELGVTTRLHETVEIGGGLGRFSFSSRFPDSDGGEELSGGRFAVTFPRFVFKPLLAIPWGSPKSPAWGFLQLYFKHTIIVGTLADEDFASLDGTDFIRTNQRVESVGVTFDLTGVANLIVDKIKKQP